MKKLGDWLRERFIYFLAWCRRNNGDYGKCVLKQGESKEEISQSVYGPKGEKLGRHFKKQFLIHMFLKYGILSTVVRWTSKILGKYIDKEVPKEEYNVNLMVFDKAYDQAVEDWCKVYMPIGRLKEPKEFKRHGKELHDVYFKGWKDPKKYKGHRPTLMTLKHLAMSLPLNDTAYFEFFNLLMYNIAQGMYDEYHKGYKDGKINIVPKVEPTHVFYANKNSIDPAYFAIVKATHNQRKKELQADVARVPKTADINKSSFVEDQLKITLEQLKAREVQMNQGLTQNRSNQKQVSDTLNKIKGDKNSKK